MQGWAQNCLFFAPCLYARMEGGTGGGSPEGEISKWMESLIYSVS